MPRRTLPLPIHFAESSEEMEFIEKDMGPFKEFLKNGFRWYY